MYEQEERETKFQKRKAKNSSKLDFKADESKTREFKLNDDLSQALDVNKDEIKELFENYKLNQVYLKKVEKELKKNKKGKLTH
jgi:predicted transcriptional regulator